MELFDEVVPRTARNFLEIAAGTNPQRFSYTNTIFHRIIPNFMLQVRGYQNNLKLHSFSHYRAEISRILMEPAASPSTDQSSTMRTSW